MKKGQRAGLCTTTVRRHAHTATPDRTGCRPGHWPALICAACMHLQQQGPPGGIQQLASDARN